jgi:cytochrome d oxidase subunit CydB
MTLFDLISYDVLRVIWWGLLGVLLIGFALTDGFDMGVGALLPFVGKTDTERRMVINTVGPVWEGNQVWFILGGGAIFAAWPPLYAVSFSGFYLAMFVVLAAFIVRPVAFKYRSKRVAPAWRSAWDWALFAGGAVPALIFGVAVGNVLQGVPFHLTDTLYPMYDGSFHSKFLGLLNPFALLVGVVSLAMLLTHGAAWLGLKSEGVIVERARRIGTITGIVTMAGFALSGLWLAVGVEGYAFTGPVVTDGPSNPLMSEVARTGSWLVGLCRAALDRRGPCPRLSRHRHGDPWPAVGLRGGHASVVQARHLRDDLDRWAHDVPLHPALDRGPQQLAHRLGQLQLAPDAFHHACRDGDLHADHPCLHRLGLPGALGQGDRGRRHRQQRHRLLKETPDVVFRLASRPSARRPLRRRQRHVAGDA